MASSNYRASICVYCGSRPGLDPVFTQSAAKVGEWLGRFGFRLVYGAGDTGIMGAVANAATRVGGQTLGIIPAHLANAEIEGEDRSDYIITENMHERKKVMFMNSDATVALPGGPGTLDELFEVLTWRQLGLHGKPVLLLNVAGFWNPLVILIEHLVNMGFADQSFRDSLEVFDSNCALFDRLQEIAGDANRFA